MILYTKHLVVNIFDIFYLQWCLLFVYKKTDSYAVDLQ